MFQHLTKEINEIMKYYIPYRDPLKKPYNNPSFNLMQMDPIDDNFVLLIQKNRKIFDIILHEAFLNISTWYEKKINKMYLSGGSAYNSMFQNFKSYEKINSYLQVYDPNLYFPYTLDYDVTICVNRIDDIHMFNDKLLLQNVCISLYQKLENIGELDKFTDITEESIKPIGSLSFIHRNKIAIIRQLYDRIPSKANIHYLIVLAIIDNGKIRFEPVVDFIVTIDQEAKDKAPIVSRIEIEKDSGIFHNLPDPLSLIKMTLISYINRGLADRTKNYSYFIKCMKDYNRLNYFLQFFLSLAAKIKMEPINSFNEFFKYVTALTNQCEHQYFSQETNDYLMIYLREMLNNLNNNEKILEYHSKILNLEEFILAIKYYQKKLQEKIVSQKNLEPEKVTPILPPIKVVEPEILPRKKLELEILEPEILPRKKLELEILEPEILPRKKLELEIEIEIDFNILFEKIKQIIEKEIILFNQVNKNLEELKEPYQKIRESIMQLNSLIQKVKKIHIKSKDKDKLLSPMLKYYYEIREKEREIILAYDNLNRKATEQAIKNMMEEKGKRRSICEKFSSSCNIMMKYLRYKAKYLKLKNDLKTKKLI
jgi:hypothetical protein